MNSSGLLFRAPPALMSAAGFPKRHKGRGIFLGQNVFLRWLRRPSILLLTAFCLLVAPSLWFVSRTAAPTPVFVAELERGHQKLPIASSQKETATTEGLPLAKSTPSLPGRPEIERGKAPSKIIVEAGAPTTPPASQSELQASDKQRSSVNPDRTGETPVLPAGVVRDVPEEECLPSPLWRKRVDTSDYEFGCDEIFTMLTGEKTLIGSGFIRDVYLVEWEGRKLVVKFVREDYEERVSEELAENIHQWEAAALDAVRGHPNIVGLLGICGASSVSEYYAAHLDDLVLSPGAKPLGIYSVVSLALDAARGLQALHEAPGGPIVHYDIKPQQMMLDKDGRVKINDLNTCQFADADVDGNSCPFVMSAVGVDAWRAPENIAGEKLTEKVDLYALAMVYYCMLARHSPYKNVKNATGMIEDGIPPPTDPSWHAGFLEIVQDMWQHDPKARPSARRVVQRLEILQKQVAATVVPAAR